MADWSGEDYRRLSRLQDAVGADALAAFSEFLPPGAVAVLDLGCGDGRRTAEIADRLPGGQVLGVDASPRMIAAASEVARPGRLAFRCQRAQDLEDEGAFDRAISLNALHWVPRAELPDVLRRLHRALVPGGVALLQLVGATAAGAAASLEQTAMDVASRSRWRPRFSGFAAPFTHPARAELQAWCADAGFSVRSAEQRTHVWPFPSRAAFGQWAAVGFRDWTGRLPDVAEQQEFVRDVVDTYCDQLGTTSDFRFEQLRVLLDRP